MEGGRKKGPGAPTDATAPGRTLKSVRDVAQRSKLLIVLFDGYAKVYSDSPASMHVVQIPACDTVEEERQVVDVVDEHILQLAHIRSNITGHGDVYQEHR